MKRFKRWGDRVRSLMERDPRDSRPYYEASFVFQAADMDEAESLYDRMLDVICGDHTAGEGCPHFRVGGLHLMDEDT